MAMLNFGGNKKNKMSVEVHGKGEFDVFCSMIKFSKEQIFAEMKTVLNANKEIESKMDDLIFKHNIVCSMQNCLADIDEFGMNNDETVFIPVDGPEEAELMADFAGKMFDKVSKEGFNDKTKNVQEIANNITYSGELFVKLSKIANLSTTKESE